MIRSSRYSYGQVAAAEGSADSRHHSGIVGQTVVRSKIRIGVVGLQKVFDCTGKHPTLYEGPVFGIVEQGHQCRRNGLCKVTFQSGSAFNGSLDNTQMSLHAAPISEEVSSAASFAEIEKAKALLDTERRIGDCPDYVINRHGRNGRGWRTCI